jgi:hypothetical protein
MAKMISVSTVMLLDLCNLRKPFPMGQLYERANQLARDISQNAEG